MSAPAISESPLPGSLARSWWLPVFFLFMFVLFYFANSAAYQGYFSGDDLDRTGWSSFIGIDTFYHELLTPKLSENAFRPIGCLYYRFLWRTFNLTYWPYVAVLQTGHFLNVILLFLFLRRLEFAPFAACAGTLFYAFHAMLIKAYWEPQYMFEVLACMFCLITMLLYARGRWILALIPFWLAYKSKEIAVTLPIALLAFEMLLGSRKWKRLIPFFLISLNFGLQALWMNGHVSLESGYVLRFTPAMLWRTVTFYSSTIAFLPLAGFALLLLPVVVRDRRLYLGFVFTAALFAPMLVLPGRLESVYWYIPMLGLAIAFSAIASKTPRWVMAVFFAAWLPLNYAMLREGRRAELAVADDNRWFTTGLLDYARRVPQLKAVVYEGIPGHLGVWGVEGAIHHTFGYQVEAVWYMSPRASQAMAEVPMAIVSYYPVPHTVKGMLRTRNELQSYIRFSDLVPKSQFGAGWSEDGGDQRSIAPEAELTLYRPQEAKQFELVASASSGRSNITVLEDGQSLGTQSLAEAHPRSLRWTLTPSAAGNKRITIRTVRPGVRRTSGWGVVVNAIGYGTP